MPEQRLSHLTAVFGGFDFFAEVPEMRLTLTLRHGVFCPYPTQR